MRTFLGSATFQNPPLSLELSIKLALGAKMSRKKEVACAEFERTRKFIGTYSSLDKEELDIVTVWAMGTWCFSPMCKWPATWPYLYITGAAGSGKTVLGQDCMGATCRTWRSATGATGPTLFRMLGREDEETGEIENLAPTLCMDEIDATFSGTKDEPLRLSLNEGYKMGGTIPRAAGRSYVDFPIYGPKLMMGIENGHLPETVTQRSIRIELQKISQDEKEQLGIKDFLIWEVQQESAEIQQMLSDWAKAHSMVLRDYNPAFPKGLTSRQWEIGRSLVQLGHAMGIEQRILRSLLTVLGRKRGQESAKQRLYAAISELFEQTGVTKLPTAAIMAHLAAKGIGVPGGSGKGLASLLSADGIQPKSLWIDDPAHPYYKEENGRMKPTHRGYQRYQFDQVFVDYLPDTDEDDD